MAERVISLEKRMLDLEGTVNGNSSRPGLIERVTETEELIGGSPRGEPGIVHSLRGVVKDMYDQVNGFGVIPRIGAIEKDKIRMDGQMQGAQWAVKIMWTLAGSIFTYALTHFLKL